jgi:YebC/PmpR family DNA-binding regulatory protein
MAGHNKWSQIKHKKAKEDSKRAQAFTKLIKEITVSARTGGGDPAGNAHLRQLLEKGKDINMPIENAQRAIKRGTGELPGINYEEFTYEGYGPGGIAIIVETLSDNKNRTVASLRHIFSKHGGNLGDTGSVNWMFEQLGVIHATHQTMTEDTLLEALLDFDIKDIRVDKNWFTVICEPKSLDQVKKAVQETGMHIENASLEWVAKNTTNLDSAQEEKALELLSALQDDEDVKNVFTNLA